MQNSLMQHLHSREAATERRTCENVCLHRLVSSPRLEQTFRPYQAHCWAHNFFFWIVIPPDSADWILKSMWACWFQDVQVVDVVSVAHRQGKSARTTSCSDFGNPTLTIKSAESVRSASRCVSELKLKNARGSGYLCALSVRTAILRLAIRRENVQWKRLLSLLVLTAPGRLVLVFCSTCCISQEVCCEVRLRVRKIRSWDVWWMYFVWCDSYTGIVYDMWHFALSWRIILCSTNTKYCCYNKQTCHTQVIVSFSICSNIFPLHSLLLDVSLLSVWKSVCARRCCATWNHNLGPRCGPCESILCSVSFEIYAIRRSCSHALALNEHEAFPS